MAFSFRPPVTLATPASSPSFFQTQALPQFQTQTQPSFSPSPAFGASVNTGIVQQQQQQQQPQQQQQQIQLFTNDKTPIAYQTKWSDIHPDSQKFLLSIEERILQYRDENEKLDQCARLYDTSSINEDFEVDAARILQELGGISTAIDREKVSLRQLINFAKDLFRNAEVAVRSFVMLMPRFIRQPVSSATTSGAPAVSTGVNISNPASSPSTTSTTSLSEFYSGLPTKPSPFLCNTISRFERQLSEFRKWIEELERLLLSEKEEHDISTTDTALLQSFPLVLSNVHDYFIYVAAQVENLHQRVQSMRSAFLADQRRRGDENDPFLEADRREMAKREAAMRRVHPAMNAAALPQPSTQAAGLFTSSAAPASAFSGMPPVQSNTSGFGISSSGAGFSILGTPAASTNPSPSPSPFGTAGAASISSFGSSPSMFGANTPSPFSSTMAASSPSLFSTPAFGSSSTGLLGATPGTSTNVFGTSTTAGGLFSSSQPASLFNTSSSFGTGTSSSSNFGNTKTRPKSRTTRR